jgi:DNA polymerase-3 subunit alpha
MATLSDSSGQFVATVFDDMVAAQVEDAAKAGACALLGVELDRRPGEEAPRVTLKSVQSFETLSKRTRLQMEVEIEGVDVLPRLAQALAAERGGNGILRLTATFDRGEAGLILGRDFQLDAETAARIERLDGVTSVRLSAAEPPRLALVG